MEKRILGLSRVDHSGTWNRQTPEDAVMWCVPIDRYMGERAKGKPDFFFGVDSRWTFSIGGATIIGMYRYSR